MTPGRDLIRSTGRIFDEPPLILLTWRIQQSNTLRIGHRLTSRLDLLSSLCSFPNHFLHFPTVSTVNLWFGRWNNLLWFLFLRASLLSLAVYMQTDEWEGYWERAAMERSLQIKTPDCGTCAEWGVLWRLSRRDGWQREGQAGCHREVWQLPRLRASLPNINRDSSGLCTNCYRPFCFLLPFHPARPCRPVNVKNENWRLGFTEINSINLVRYVSVVWSKWEYVSGNFVEWEEKSEQKNLEIKSWSQAPVKEGEVSTENDF